MVVGRLKRPALAVNPPVFFVSAALLLVCVVFGALFPETAGVMLPKALDVLATHFGWLYTLAMAFFVIFVLWLVFSPYARIRLGDDDSRPDFSTITWFSMLFSAGMGIGLVFYGVAEPMMHYIKPPTGPGRTQEAAERALSITMFHWGVHAWAVYVVMGLAIAYFSYRKKLPLALRSALYPLLGERIHGVAGHVVDILAVFGTLFGLATSLGLGAMQINAGLDHLFGIPQGRTSQLILIAVITAAATISLVTGVNKGIRRLSELNMVLAALLLLFVFAVGPTLFVLNSFSENVGLYLTNLAHRTFWLDAHGDGKWLKGWTLFYWAWWIAWSPFVGMFVARVSRGRTIREFILGVVLVPTLVTFVWLTVFGDTAMYLERFEGGIADAVASNVSTAIYVMLERLPFAEVTCLLAVCVVAVFFVTSSDSASFVVDMLTSGGNPSPPRWQRVFWAVAEGTVAAILIAVSGREALEALQAAVVCIGVPFCIVLILMCLSLVKALRSEKTHVLATAVAHDGSSASERQATPQDRSAARR